MCYPEPKGYGSVIHYYMIENLSPLTSRLCKRYVCFQQNISNKISRECANEKRLLAHSAKGIPLESPFNFYPPRLVSPPNGKSIMNNDYKNRW